VWWLFKCFLIDLPTLKRYFPECPSPCPCPSCQAIPALPVILVILWRVLGVCLLNTEPGDLRILLPGQQVAAVIHLSRCHSCQCRRCCRRAVGVAVAVAAVAAVAVVHWHSRCWAADSFVLRKRGKGRGIAIWIMPGQVHKSRGVRALEGRRKAEGARIKDQGSRDNGQRRRRRWVHF